MRHSHHDGPARSGAVFFAALCALAAVPGAVEGRELSIEASACAKDIRIHAQDVPLQEIVGGLANAMGVKLVAKTSLPEPVTFDASGAPEEVLKRLLHGKNLVVETQPKAACGSREVLATIWLLPSGQDAVRPAEEARPTDAAPPRGSRHRGRPQDSGDQQPRGRVPAEPAQADAPAE